MTKPGQDGHEITDPLLSAHFPTSEPPGSKVFTLTEPPAFNGLDPLSCAANAHVVDPAKLERRPRRKKAGNGFGRRPPARLYAKLDQLWEMVPDGFRPANCRFRNGKPLRTDLVDIAMAYIESLRKSASSANGGTQELQGAKI